VWLVGCAADAAVIKWYDFLDDECVSGWQNVMMCARYDIARSVPKHDSFLRLSAAHIAEKILAVKFAFSSWLCFKPKRQSKMKFQATSFNSFFIVPSK
jgi:hypothetical protein